MSSITIWVSKLILVGVQFTHEMLFHHFKTLSLCCQGIVGEFTNSEDSTISLYVCSLCGILSLRVPLDQFSYLSLFNLHFVALVSLFSSFFNSYFLPSILSSFSKRKKEDTMQSIRHESR